MEGVLNKESLPQTSNIGCIVCQNYEREVFHKRYRRIAQLDPWVGRFAERLQAFSLLRDWKMGIWSTQLVDVIWCCAQNASRIGSARLNPSVEFWIFGTNPKFPLPHNTKELNISQPHIFKFKTQNVHHPWPVMYIQYMCHLSVSKIACYIYCAFHVKPGSCMNSSYYHTERVKTTSCWKKTNVQGQKHSRYVFHCRTKCLLFACINS